MKIVISPAKSLDFETELPAKKYTEPQFLKESAAIHKVLKKMKPGKLSGLMDISEKLAALNWERNQAWEIPFTLENSRQAIYAFNGDVYTGLDSYSLPIEKLEALQDKLRILSGLYGVLRPLDLIQPYRLEMGTKLQVGKHKNLYEFWKAKITKSLNSELEKGELFINLASSEYFDSVDLKILKVPVVTPEFRDYKDGSLKMISFFAKKARGMMVRYIADTNAATTDDLKKFDYEGYRFDASLSAGNKLVFTR
ncbi:MAG TPA: peroxide stress protein YaaA [Flavobacterium sp.]|nr:peroxide stress protein YaaA [Flavobacterium sp.]